MAKWRSIPSTRYHFKFSFVVIFIAYSRDSVGDDPSERQFLQGDRSISPGCRRGLQHVHCPHAGRPVREELIFSISLLRLFDCHPSCCYLANYGKPRFKDYSRCCFRKVKGLSIDVPLLLPIDFSTRIALFIYSFSKFLFRCSFYTVQTIEMSRVVVKKWQFEKGSEYGF